MLSANAHRQDVEAFIEAAKRQTDPGDRNNIEAVLQVSIAANQGLYDEIRRNSVMCDALRELMREEIEEEKRNVVQEAERTILEIIKSLMNNLNLTADQAMSAMNFSVEKQAEYREKL